MIRAQGKRITDEELDRIKHLLAMTDIGMKDIATRMGCSPSLVASINRRFDIRRYHGRKSIWQVAAADAYAADLSKAYFTFEPKNWGGPSGASDQENYPIPVTESHEAGKTES